jgi:hypothetical protein
MKMHRIGYAGGKGDEMKLEETAETRFICMDYRAQFAPCPNLRHKSISLETWDTVPVFM